MPRVTTENLVARAKKLAQADSKNAGLVWATNVLSIVEPVCGASDQRTKTLKEVIHAHSMGKLNAFGLNALSRKGSPRIWNADTQPPAPRPSNRASPVSASSTA
jgi:hypothetical protein